MGLKRTSTHSHEHHPGPSRPSSSSSSYVQSSPFWVSAGGDWGREEHQESKMKRKANRHWRVQLRTFGNVGHSGGRHWRPCPKLLSISLLASHQCPWPEDAAVSLSLCALQLWSKQLLDSSVKLGLHWQLAVSSLWVSAQAWHRDLKLVILVGLKHDTHT